MMRPGVAAKEVDKAMRDIISHYPTPTSNQRERGTL